jgi:hypothetical protein
VDESMVEPGAKRSRRAPRFEKPEIPSASVVEPTVIAVDMQPGVPTPAGWPSLPAEMTVATFCAIRRSIAALRESASQATELLSVLPRLMLAETMSLARVLPVCSVRTRWRPRTWSDAYVRTQGAGSVPQSDALLKRVKTWMPTRSASGATPAVGAPVTPVPSPIAMPATWLPWSQMLLPMFTHCAVSASADPPPV